MVMTGEEGYFLAKHQMQDAIDQRIELLNLDLREHFSKNEQFPQLAFKMIINELKNVRNYVRNFLLWDHKND